MTMQDEDQGLSRIPVSQDSLLRRVNAALDPQGKMVVARFHPSTSALVAGTCECFEVTFREGAKTRRVDLEQLARSLGLVADFESVQAAWG